MLLLSVSHSGICFPCHISIVLICIYFMIQHGELVLSVSKPVFVH